MTMRFQLRLCLLACPLVVLASVPPPALADDDYFGNIQLSSAELREIGLAIGGTGVEPFPNTCGDAAPIPLSVSNEMLAHFTAKGFTLESLCLGAGGMIRHDPETGRQLPAAIVDGKHGVMLNLPACFAGGTPYQDCDVRFNEEVYFEIPAEEREAHKAQLAALDAKVRVHISAHGVTGKFDWADLGDSDAYEGSIGYFLVSPALPRGYGYALLGTGAPDPQADVDLGTYRTQPTRWSIWLDELLGRN
ncbi:MAG: hypothetical protein AB7S70_11815 [Hyphomicrobium sp.]|uniref:hypothetical protein n=1 Tax=Hyphomicrobium sp. TaxID=82 RepID=UPI003D112584